MPREQVVGLNHGIIHEYTPPSEIDGELRESVAIVRLINSAEEEIFESIAGARDLEPGTPVLLARIDTEDGIMTEIIPKELF